MIPAGRRSGKTELAKRNLVMNLPVRKPWPNPRYGYGAPTHRQARMIAWKDLLSLIPASWITGVNKTDQIIETIFGSELHVTGLDQPQRIEGPPWDGWAIDEMSDQKPGMFDTHIRPALADRAGWAWMFGKPYRAGIGSVDYKKLYDYAVQSGDPDWAAFTWFSADILPHAEVAAAKRSMDPKTFREQMEASWESPAGLVYYTFEARNKRPTAYDPAATMLVGSDFNVSPMAWVLCHRVRVGDHDHLLQFDEIYIQDSNTREALDVLFSRYGAHQGGFEFYGDATSQNRSTSAAESDYEQILSDQRFRGLGRTVHYPRSNPPLADRYAAVNAMILNAAGDRRYFIDPDKCPATVFDLENGYYKPGTREAQQTDELSHATSGLGYIIHELWPVQSIAEWTPGPMGIMGDSGIAL